MSADQPSNSRTSSFSFIKRTKSSDLLGERKASGGRLRKKSLDGDQRPAVKDEPPALPVVPAQPVIQSFGGENYVPKMPADVNGKHSTPPPAAGVSQDSPHNGAATDPYARTESMTHRSRYSYAHSTSSTLNSPRRIRRRKDPTPYNILVIGAKNSGKTSFINFLNSSLALPARKQHTRTTDGDSATPAVKSYNNFTHHYQEIEIDHERIGLTLWDSKGLEKGVVDLQLRELTNFVESKFEETFVEEMKVVRSPGVRDTEIHCVFMILDPSRLDSNIQAAQQTSNPTSHIGKVSRIIGGLDEDFDLQVMRSFLGKTTVVPIISKADTVTTAHMAYLKKVVWQSLKQAGLDPLESLNVGQESEDDQIDEEDEEYEDIEADGEDTSMPASPKTDASEALPAPAMPDNAQASHKRQSSASGSNLMMDSGYVPLSILSPDQYSLDFGDGPVGRKFPWGFADPYNPEHCDFVKLKDAVFGEWRNDVREATRELFYERWRTNRLNRQSVNKVTSNSGQSRKSGGIPIGLVGKQRTSRV